MARAIDKDYLLIHKRKVRFFGIGLDDESWGYAVPVEVIESALTLTPPNEWVSVEERLPENHAQVLMWSAKWNIEEAGSYCNGRFWVYSEIRDAYIADDITHWMLLPAPPGTGLSSG